MLFIPERHEPLRGAPWSAAAAKNGVERIASATLAAFDSQTLWPVHPDDADEAAAVCPAASLYFGAAGVVWALRRLQLDGLIALPLDLDPTIAGLAEQSRRFNHAAGIAAPSFLLGDSGVLLLQWKALRDPAAADALFALAEGNLHNPTLEALWGSSGTLIAVLHMIDDLATPADQARWIDLLRRGARILFDQMHLALHSVKPEGDTWLWTQDMYGKQLDYLGAGHGFAGNLYPILRGARWLDADLVRQFEERAERTLDLVAEHDGGAVNWPPHFDRAALGLAPKPLMQDCHGAPGIVCRLAATGSPMLRQLLLKGGEAVWRAGPLSKPPGLCHGTDGNGYALLKLHQMTGDARWLDRARMFAMHALAQSEAAAAAHGQLRFSLWTGDLGLAAYLSSCLRADPAFPTLDVF